MKTVKGAAGGFDRQGPKQNTQGLSVREIVLSTCQAIAQDSNSPPAARVQAARTLAEMAGLLGKVQTGTLSQSDTPTNEMTPEDIDAELRRLAPKVKTPAKTP